MAASALALAQLAAPAVAQHQHMPGMTMPMPAKPAAKKPAVKKKAAPKKKTAAVTKTPAKKAVAKPKAAEAPMAGMTMPMEHGAAPATAQAMPMDHSQVDHSQIGQIAMKGMQHGEHAGHQMAMTGALGSYPMERESSGTAWQPDTSEHTGLDVMSGDWTLMAHGVVNLVYDHQSGPRGDDKGFASGMLMGMARRPLANGTVQF